MLRPLPRRANHSRFSAPSRSQPLAAKPKSTRSRRTLTAANLEALGAPRLAGLLLELAEDQPAAKRWLRMALAAAVGPKDLADEIDKRLAAVRASQARVHWRRAKAFRRDLTLLRRMIAEDLAAADPAAGLVAMLRFVALQRGVLSRLSDAKGEAAQIFVEGLADLARIATLAAPPPADLVDAVAAALDDGAPSAMAPLTAAVLPALDDLAVAVLRARIETLMAPQRRVNAGWRAALQVLLDRQGDAAAFAATFTASEQVLPPIGARIASRFLKVGDVERARQALERSDPYRRVRPGAPVQDPDAGTRAWEGARIDVMAAEGRPEDAQAARWALFERDLSDDALDAYLRHLSGFDDVVALDRAIDHARTYPRLLPALRFLLARNALAEAAGLVLARRHELDGLAFETLEPAARALEPRHPLAATVILRAMVGDVVRFAQSEAYDRARTWLLEAASLEAQIADWGELESHAAFEQALRAYRRW